MACLVVSEQSGRAQISSRPHDLANSFWEQKNAGSLAFIWVAHGPSCLRNVGQSTTGGLGTSGNVWVKSVANCNCISEKA